MKAGIALAAKGVSGWTSLVACIESACSINPLAKVIEQLAQVVPIHGYALCFEVISLLLIVVHNIIVHVVHCSMTCKASDGYASGQGIVQSKTGHGVRWC